MNKKLILLAVLLSGISVVAMERIQKRPVLQEVSHHEEKSLVNICLSDSANPATTYEVAIPLRLAKLIGALNELVEDPYAKGSVFPLLNVTIPIWRLIEPQLERVYGIAHDASQAAQLREALMTEFRKLEVKSLIGVICASEYLDIPILLESACEVIKRVALGKISWEELELLPWHICNQIIMNMLLMLLGTVPGRELAVCRGHANWVNSVSVTKDGKIVSGSGGDKTVRVWDMQGNQLALCRGHESMVTSVCVTEDGKIISGSFDKTVRVWDMHGNQLAVCRGHAFGVYSVCVTKDGKIVSGSWDNMVRVWDMQGNQLAVCRGHEDGVNSVWVTQDGKIVSGSKDQTVRVWDMQGNELAVCRGHEDWVNSVCVTQDGKILSGSRDNTVRVWDMQGNRLAVCRGHEDRITSVCVTHDGKIVSGSRDKTVRIWDMKGNQLAVCRGHEDWVNSVCVTEDGRIVSASEDGTVRVWGIQLLDSIVRMGEDQARALWAVRQLPDNFNKQTCWREIEKILGEDAPVAATNNNNKNNE